MARKGTDGGGMATKLIELDDGVLVEAEVAVDEAQPIAGGLTERVNSTFGAIKPILVKTCLPIAAAWREMSQEMHIEKAEIELGLSFEGEGNLYVAKSKAGANLKVTLVLKPEPESQE
jgi:hypothetical protein